MLFPCKIQVKPIKYLQEEWFVICPCSYPLLIPSCMDVDGGYPFPAIKSINCFACCLRLLVSRVGEDLLSVSFGVSFIYQNGNLSTGEVRGMKYYPFQTLFSVIQYIINIPKIVKLRGPRVSSMGGRFIRILSWKTDSIPCVEIRFLSWLDSCMALVSF